MPLEWTISPERAFVPGYNAWQNKVRMALITAIQRRVPQIEQWMKANAPWRDLTGEARRRLWAQMFVYLEGILVIFDHDVIYGRRLEFEFSGRYAIIGPTIDHWGPILMNDVVKVLARG